MSRKAAYATKASLNAANKLSTLEEGYPNGHIENSNESRKQRQPRIQKEFNTVGVKTVANCGSNNVAMDTNGGDSDGSDGEEADADEDSSDVEDPDAIAPSGSSTEVDGHQTGLAIHNQNESTTVKELGDCVSPTAHHESSDDEVYDGVDLISDSEKDGSDMDHLEERAIVESENTDDPQRKALSSQHELSQHDDTDNIWDGLDLDHSLLDEPSDFFHEQLSQMEQDNLYSDYDNGLTAFTTDIDFAAEEPSDVPYSPRQRRVRFAEPLHLEIAGSNPYDDENLTMFPRDDTPAPVLSPILNMNDDQESDSDSSSGYESDYGETTDEDDVPASATARPQALIRSTLTSSSKPASSTTPSPTRNSSIQRRGPRMGSWCVDPTKPLAFVDSCGKRLLVCPARRPTKPDRVFEHILGSGSTTANTSPHPAPSRLASMPRDSDVDYSGLSSPAIVSPMFGPPNALDSILSNNNLLTSSDMYSDYSAGNMAVYADLEYDDDDDDHEDGITMDDLFNFGNQDDDSEAELESARPSSSESNMSIAGQDSRTLLDHLDRGVVTAFRQTQRQAEQQDEDMLQLRSPLRKRKASPPLHAASKRRIIA